jgi:hypothetical protein
MPYALRKVPKKDLYWVVNKDTGKKHSKEGLPKENAEAQMRALYAAESGYTMKGSGISMNFMQQMAQSAYRGKTKLQIGPFKLLTSTPTLKFYKDDKRIVIAVRGTELTDKVDLAADALAIVGNLRKSERWKRDEAKIKEVQEKFPRGEYRYTAVGHSLGGALIDLMLRDKLVQNALSYNPLVEPQELGGNPLHRRIYHKDDPLYQSFGRFIPNVEVRTTAEPFWKYYLKHNLPFGLGELFTLYDRHRIARFKGGSKLEGGMTFNDFRRWWATPLGRRAAERYRLTGTIGNDDITRGELAVGILGTLLGWGGTFYGLSTDYRSNEDNTGVHPAAASIAFTGILGSPMAAAILARLVGELPLPPTAEEDRERAAERERQGPAPEGRTFFRRIREALGQAEPARPVETLEGLVVRNNPMRRAAMRTVFPPVPARTMEEMAARLAATAERAVEAREEEAAGVGDLGPRQVVRAEDLEDESDEEADVGNDRDGDGAQDVRAFYNPFNLAALRAQTQGVELPARPEIVAEALAEEGQLTGTGREIVFEDQLKELDYSPKKYLSKARAKAKKAGYDPKKLSFCRSGVHKLRMETPEGEMVSFGRVGYGDFLIWSFLERNGKVEKGEAKKRRKLYLKRASKIKGDWEDNKFSANNLAMKILW